MEESKEEEVQSGPPEIEAEAAKAEETTAATDEATAKEQPGKESPGTEPPKLYHISFRGALQPKAASAKIPDLKAGEMVMVHTDHGLEPGCVCGSGIKLPPINLDKPGDVLAIVRRATPEEFARYQNLLQREQEAKAFCQAKIKGLGLEMKLLQVERFFNGSKIIFYFSADTRVDFRDLVKSLVQEFRTRVEMRQIGVRHETQMLGGIGCCGRELCCGLFMKDFAPVSIKMAKEQDLPLNPAKISGVCNRLLCCLTHEYETYKSLKKGMPKVGRVVTFEDKQYKVTQCKTLTGTVTLASLDPPGETRMLSREEWEKGVSAGKDKPPQDERQESRKPQPAAAPPPSVPKTPPADAPAGGKPQTPGRHHHRDRGKQPPPGKPPQAHKPPTASKTPSERPQGGRPEHVKPEGGKPGGGKSHRSRRSRGGKKGKTP